MAMRLERRNALKQVPVGYTRRLLQYKRYESALKTTIQPVSFWKVLRSRLCEIPEIRLAMGIWAKLVAQQLSGIEIM